MNSITQAYKAMNKVQATVIVPDYDNSATVYMTMNESTQDLNAYIGKERTQSLLSTEQDPEVFHSHNKVFGKGNGHIEIHFPNHVPGSVQNHIASQGDVLVGNKVRLNTGRMAELGKYLSKSKAPKSVMDDHENWARNKGKIVLTRNAGEVASSDTDMNWNKGRTNLPIPSQGGANVQSNSPAGRMMAGELRHGTLMAMHVKQSATPNSDGEYDSKDILGRTLIKRHLDKDGNSSFHREQRSYGDFPEAAHSHIDNFLNANYPMIGASAKKHDDVYNDDGNDLKINPKFTNQ